MTWDYRRYPAAYRDPRIAASLVGIGGAAGGALGALAAVLNRKEGESGRELGRQVLKTAGRGAALGAAGMVGAIASLPLQNRLAGIFALNRGGIFACRLSQEVLQFSLVGATVGLYRAAVPHNTHLASQTFEQRLRTFLPDDIRSSAQLGLLWGLLSGAIAAEAFRLT